MGPDVLNAICLLLASISRRAVVPIVNGAPIALIILAGTFALPASAGDLWQREALTDVEGGPREKLSEKGLDLGLWVTQVSSAFLSGDGTHDLQYGGKVTATGDIDAGKLIGLGGFSVNAIFEHNFGDDTNSLDDGTIVPVNGITAFPRLTGHDSDLSLNFTQRFGENVFLSLGKFNLLHIVSRTPILGGGGEETFINAAFAGPLTGIVPPYLLAGMAKVRTDPADFTLMVYDPRSATDDRVLTHPLEEGVSISVAATLKTEIGDLPGFYGLRGVYSSAEGLDLSRIPEFVALPPESEKTLTRDDYWYLNASVQQYLYLDPDNPGAGWGLFGYAAISDGNPNPYRWTAFAGLAGNNPFFGRSMDKWGIGYFRYGLSNDLKDGLDDLGIGVGDEQGIELFYNLALTPWLKLTADLQWIDPATSASGDALLGTLRMRSIF